MAKEIPQSNTQGVSHEAIARRAYEIWQSEGCPDGRAMEHWLRALSDLKRQSTRQSPQSFQNPANAPESISETRDAAESETRREGGAKLKRRAASPRVGERRFQTAGR